ncbi:MAG: hypothetical protein NTV09_00960 [Bacteroidetes bacterium]|nr:hypothetical protein [Bacteroidota bacterium]
MKKIICFLLLATSASVAFSLNPSREYKVRPDKYGMVYKEEKVPTKDGASLNAWFFELDKKTTNWIVISGSGDGNMAAPAVISMLTRIPISIPSSLMTFMVYLTTCVKPGQ